MNDKKQDDATPVENRFTAGAIKSVKGWLIASIGTNLFLAGCVVAVLLRPPGPFDLGPFPPPPFYPDAKGPGRPLPGPDPQVIFDKLSSEMSPQDASTFRSICARAMADFHANEGDMHRTMQKLAALLRQDKPDSSSIKAALDDIQKSHNQMHVLMTTILQRTTAELSLDGRRKVADFLDQMP